MAKQVHESHDMTEWEGTIVTLVATSRFGEVRECKNCGAEQARTVAGEAAAAELEFECEVKI